MNTQRSYQIPPIDFRAYRRLEAMSNAELIELLKICGDLIVEDIRDGESTMIELVPDAAPWPIKTTIKSIQFILKRREFQVEGVK